MVGELGPIRCAVIGQPISHSQSPAIHLAFARQMGLALDYQRIECAPTEFAITVRAFFAAGGRGLNVTLPHKAAALALAHRASTRAQQAGAANTLGVDADGSIWADNTDGIGLLRDLERLGVAVAGQRVLLLGAGGAAAGIVPALLAAQLAALGLANRTPERAINLLRRLAEIRDTVGWVMTHQLAAAPLAAGRNQSFLTEPRRGAHSAHQDAPYLASAADQPYSLVINTTSDGAAELLAGLPLVRDGCGYDLNYGPRAALTLAAMRALGLSTCHDGRGMLIEQAAQSFQLWHGLRPETGALHAAPL